LLCTTLHAQQPHKETHWVDRSLLATDAILRVGDGITTSLLLNDPCRCYYEVDPIAPKGGRWWEVYGFQAAAEGSLTTGSRWLSARHHKKLARTAMILSIGGEVWAMQLNVRELYRGTAVRPMPGGLR
jgi:hypothetical protein